MKIRTPYWLIIGSLVGAAGVSRLSNRPNRGVHARTEVTPMKIRTLSWLFIGSLVGAALLIALVVAGSSRPTRAAEPPAPKAEDFSPYVTKDGGISLPLDYREKFVHLGTYAVATKPGNPVDEMHNVYARPEDVQAYRRDGKFPDGAVLVKDVTTAGSENLTTGQSTWTKDVKIWFVMVKDAKGRFPKNDLWGDGWGWALFEAKDPKKNVATDYKTDCKLCHVPARKDDWVYVRGYPVLKK
jgi:cytochrome c